MFSQSLHISSASPLKTAALPISFGLKWSAFKFLAVGDLQ